MNNDNMSFVMLAIQGLVGCASFIILAGVMYFLFLCIKRVPAQFRVVEPVMVFLMLIPCVNIVWAFFLYQRIPISFKKYFDSVGDTSVDDCGEKLGLYLAISSIICAPVALVLLVMYLLKLNELKKRIPADAV